jgi:hypothetical protein
MIQDIYRTNTKHKKSNFTNYIIDTPDPLELLTFSLTKSRSYRS